jgi:predicted Zn-dependent peptidase
VQLQVDLSNEHPPRRTVLRQGAVLLTRPTPDAYGVALGVWVRTGTRDEPPGLGGVSHMLEHMVFKGTDRRSAFELARDMEAIGASIDAYTTKEYTAYTVKVVPAKLPDALSILSEMLLHSAYAPDQLELEKKVVLEEIKSSEDTPDDFIHEKLMEHLLDGHPLSRPILGTEQSVAAMQSDALQQWAHRVHRGSNIVLSVAGAVTAREEELVACAFDLPDGGPARGAAQVAPPLAAGSWVYPRRLAQQYVEIAVPGVSTVHPDRMGVLLLSSVLGGGMSSRLFQKVREEQGLAYSICTYADFHSDAGVFCTSFSASPRSCVRALRVISAEYERLRAGDLGDDEVEMNKAQLTGSLVLGMEGSMNQMSRLARNELYHGRFIPAAELLEGIERTTRDDLVRLAQQFLDPAQQTVVGHGPARKLAFAG